jgi:hypothetical protein
MIVTKVAGAIVAIVLIVISIEFFLIYVFDVEATILQSLKYLIPIIVAFGILFSFFQYKKKEKNR